MDHAALIERLEKATGPDRELDAEIFIQVTPGVLGADRIDRDGGVVGWKPKDRPYQSARDVPRYTSSIEAALTLVPEGWEWQLQQTEAILSKLDGRFLISEDSEVFGKGPTPAITLCIAALKARVMHTAVASAQRGSDG